MFLNQQPLFSLYRRDTFLRKNYDLVHEILIGGEQAKQQVQKNDYILKLGQKYVLERACRSFFMHIFCYLCPNFTNLNEDYDKKPLIPSKYENSPLKDTEPEQSSTSSKHRKSSVFEYYDNDLDFMFLSSEEETFNKKESSPVDLTGFIPDDDEDEFELLIAGKDEEFVVDNRNLFTELVSSE